MLSNAFYREVFFINVVSLIKVFWSTNSFLIPFFVIWNQDVYFSYTNNIDYLSDLPQFVAPQVDLKSW